MAFDPNVPANDSPLDAAQMRAQLNALKVLIDALLPIGIVCAWAKNTPGVPALPGTWVECNGQVLNDPGSPLNGQTIDDLNGASGPQRFLRGASVSGGGGGSNSHIHGIATQANNGVTAGSDSYSAPASDTDAASSLPDFYEVVWAMR